MKAFLTLLTLLWILSAAGAIGGSEIVPDDSAPPSTSDSASALQSRFEELAGEWMRAYNAGDSTALAVLYIPEAQYISGHVKGLVAIGRVRIIQNFLNGVRKGGHIDSISVLEVRSSCKLATVLCEYHATNAGQKATGRNLLVLQNLGRRWLIVLHMTVV